MPSLLSDVRVADFTRVLTGPFATQTLGDMGADVIKIEPPNGDDTRAWGPPFVGDQATYFISTNRNKRSIALDMKAAAGREVAGRLLKHADVIVESFRPGVADRLGHRLHAGQRHQSATHLLLDLGLWPDRPAVTYCRP